MLKKRIFKPILILSLTFSFTFLLFGNSFVSAMFQPTNIVNEESSWEDEVNKEINEKKMKEMKEINETFKLKKFGSKENFNSFLLKNYKEKIIDEIVNSKLYYHRRFYGMGKEMMLTDSAPEMAKSTMKSEVSNVNSTSKVIDNGKIDFSKTNLQKKGVDEPEILKMDGKYIFYYNKKTKYIYVFTSPNGETELNIKNANLISKIKVPKSIVRNIQMFLTKDRLVLMGTRNSNMGYIGTKTDVVIFDISNLPNLKLVKLFETKGSLFQSRMINEKLYLVTNYSLYSFINQLSNKKEFKNIKCDVDNNEYKEERKKCLKKVEKVFESYLEKNGIGKIIEGNSFEVIQKRDENGFLNYKGVAKKTNFDNILYLDNKESKDINSFEFNIVNIIDINKAENIGNQSIIFGNLRGGQIHMSLNSLYLINNYYRNYNWKCGRSFKCVSPYYNQGDFTLIHKLELSEVGLNYVDSQIVPGRVINQYSMDEDSKGNFRIFTKYFYPHKSTDLYIFNKNLSLESKILNIAPEEELKSSRFIEDKVYLVTFKATDPLFVIDLKDIKNPKIIGELKIPGYSLYLHPLKYQDGVQYLLGIGQEAEEVHGNYSLPKNVKIDIYKVDYNKVKNGNIEVTQDKSLVIGKEQKVGNNGSYTPSFNDPRTFTYDPKTNLLFLPLYLAEDFMEERCYKNIKFGEEKCHSYTKKRNYFRGMKVFKVSEKDGINEVFSKNYDLEQVIKEGRSHYSKYDFKNSGWRVGYISNGKIMIPYTINNNFVDFVQKKQNKMIEFK